MTSVKTAAAARPPAFDLWSPIWRILTSVRFAVFFIAVLALVGFLGVVIPQIPEAMRGNGPATAAWVEEQRGTFGPFTGTMHRFGLFNVFHAKWFLIALGFLVLNVTTCTMNRWSPTFRNVFNPPKQVPESFYVRAHNRTTLAPVDPTALETELRRMRFRVETTYVRADADGGAARHIFADRYPWTQLATFISHLALILFIAGGLVTWLTGFNTEIFAGEGTTAPVFAVSDPNQMQVRVDDAVGTFGETGSPTDFRTHLTIFKNGEQVAQGTTTVNDPFEYDGYRFHQAAFFDDGAQLRIREVETGNTVFNETFPLIDNTAAPSITITDTGGAVVVRDVIAPADFLTNATGSLVRVPSTEQVIWIGLTTTEDEQAWQLIAFDPTVSGADGAGGALRLAEGTEGALSGLTIRFDEVTTIPSAVGVDVPGSDSNVLAQLTQSEDGDDVLMLVSEDRPAISLGPGDRVVVGAYEYSFEGVREFSGIAVRRDSGAWFIWVATAMLVGGLALTFYLPRRRLWIRLTPRETQIAALAEKSGGFENDMRALAKRLGAPIPPELQEERP